MKNIVEATNLSKNFGDLEVIKNVSFDVRPGICFGILGPNGAGKTTLIKMLLGLSPIESGSMQVLGYSIPKDAPKAREKIGVVPQVDNLDPEFSLRENLEIYGSYFNLEREFLEKRISHLLKFADLTSKADSKIQKLSGGMLRRLTIARSLVHDPELIILDEPTTGLDPQVRHALWDRMYALKKEGKTLLLTTHYMEEAQRLCDELIIMNHGAILERGNPKKLIEKHIEKEVVEVGNIRDRSLKERIAALQNIRIEEHQEQIICYMNDSRELLALLRNQENISIIQRPANLEDLFLKLTGRELSE